MLSLKLLICSVDYKAIDRVSKNKRTRTGEDAYSGGY